MQMHFVVSYLMELKIMKWYESTLRRDYKSKQIFEKNKVQNNLYTHIFNVAYILYLLPNILLYMLIAIYQLESMNNNKKLYLWSFIAALIAILY